LHSEIKVVDSPRGKSPSRRDTLKQISLELRLEEDGNAIQEENE
jgi:hypothetical protein